MRELVIAVILVVTTGLYAEAGLVQDAQKARTQKEIKDRAIAQKRVQDLVKVITDTLLSGQDWEAVVYSEDVPAITKYFRGLGFKVEVVDYLDCAKEVKVMIP